MLRRGPATTRPRSITNTCYGNPSDLLRGEPAGRLHGPHPFHYALQPPRHLPLVPNAAEDPSQERPGRLDFPDRQRRRSRPPIEAEEGLRPLPPAPLGPAERRGRREID